MNFLSHYFFDGKPNNPYFNLGLVIPDLMSMVQRGWKIPPHQFPRERNGNSPVREMADGVRHHLEMDKFFHNAYYFEEYSRLLRNYLKAKGLSYPPYRISFISHIFLELLLDRLLVKHRPNIVHSFYQELEATNIDSVKDFFDHLSLPYYPAFDDFLQKFVNQRFLFDYACNDTFFQIFNRIFQRVRQPLFDTAQIKSLKASFEFLENLVWQNFHKLQLEMAKFKINETTG